VATGLPENTKITGSQIAPIITSSLGLGYGKGASSVA